ncbi:MAG: CPBP family intramembrane metalloprotease [Gemmataceae bacterium]|nr:CPBP family intramembrane metalloprotease [Gemmataceae bacterium]
MDLGRELLLNLGVYSVLAAAAAAGILALGRAVGRAGETWLPIPRLRRGRWTGLEVLLCFVLYQFVPVFLIGGLDQLGFFFRIFGQNVTPLRQLNAIAPFTLPLLFALWFWLIHRFSGAYPAHVGLTPARWRGNVRLGLAAFCLATPAVLILYVAALKFTNHVPHRFEELAGENLFGFEWALLAFQAMVAAALVEEWLFRGMLQGWLRRASPLGHLVVAAVALVAGSQPFLQSVHQQAEHQQLLAAFGVEEHELDKLAALDLLPAPPVLWESLVFASAVVAVYVGGVLRLWWPVFQRGLRHFVEEPDAPDVGFTAAIDTIEGQAPLLLPSGPRWEAFKHANARWAIVGSATMFALMHEAWPSAVALVPLGLVLGWLTYRTQSLAPAIVLHGLFNAVAFGVLFLSA